MFETNLRFLLFDEAILQFTITRVGRYPYTLYRCFVCFLLNGSCVFSIQEVTLFFGIMHPPGMVIFEKKTQHHIDLPWQKSIPVRIWGEEDVPWTFSEREIEAVEVVCFSSDRYRWWQLNYFSPRFF